MFGEVRGAVAAPRVLLELVGEVDFIYNSNVSGTKGDTLTFVNEMKFGWISTIVEVCKTVSKQWDSLEGCSRRDGNGKRDVIVQRTRLFTERIMPRIISVKLGLSFKMIEEKKVKLAVVGCPKGAWRRNLWTYAASDIQCEHHWSRAWWDPTWSTR